MSDFDKVKQQKDSISENLLLPDSFFHAVGVGLSKSTNEWCVRAYVSPNNFSKVNEVKNQLQAKLSSDTSLEIVITPRANFCANIPIPLNCNSSCIRKQRIRPLVAGISTGSSSSGELGTIGYFVKSTKVIDEQSEPGTFILSCNHVIANSDFNDFQNENLGDYVFDNADDGWLEKVYQPNTAASNTIGILCRVERFEVFDPLTKKVNYVDAAIARLNSDIQVKKEILHIGKVAGRVKISDLKKTPRITICKHGINTRYTEGNVYDFSLDIFFDYLQVNVKNPNGATVKLKFVNQYFVTPVNGYPSFADSGDSGSLVVTKPKNKQNPKAVGLLFAKDSSETINKDGSLPDETQLGVGVNFIQNFAIVNPIQPVLDKLQITLL